MYPALHGVDRGSKSSGKQRSPLTRRPRGLLLALSATALMLASSCNRAALRVPGASLSFPTSASGFIASTTTPLSLSVAMPVDARDRHYGERIANTQWEACYTDGLWISSTPSVVRDRVQADLAASGLFASVSSEPAAPGDLTLSTEVDAFCSQVVGFLFLRVAGVVAITFRIERDGAVLFERRFEKVVTDADPEYTGMQIAMIEQAMNRALSDSLRELLRAFLLEIASEVPKWQPTPVAAPGLVKTDRTSDPVQ